MNLDESQRDFILTIAKAPGQITLKRIKVAHLENTNRIYIEEGRTQSRNFAGIEV